MKDPKRWSDDLGFKNELTLEVLQADRDLGPTAGDSALVWSKLSAELGLASALVGVTGTQALQQGLRSAGEASGAGAPVMAKALGPASTSLCSSRALRSG